MADEETRQILQELVSTQREYLELLRQISEIQKEQAEFYRESFGRTEKEFVELARLQNEKYQKQAQQYDEAVARYEQHRQSTDVANRIANFTPVGRTRWNRGSTRVFGYLRAAQALSGQEG